MERTEQEGFYNRSEFMMYMAEHRFMSFRDFRDVILRLRSKRFHVHADREESRNILSSMGVCGLVSPTTRFPEYGCYVDIDGHDSALLITRMLQLLDQPNRNIERNLNNPIAGSSNQTSNLQNSIFDASTAYNKIITILVSFTTSTSPLLLRGEVSMYNRPIFETNHGLIWRVRDTEKKATGM